MLSVPATFTGKMLSKTFIVVFFLFVSCPLTVQAECSYNGPCVFNSQCCSGKCFAGRCEPGKKIGLFGCVAVGGRCNTNFDCCSGLGTISCRSGRCRRWFG